MNNMLDELWVGVRVLLRRSRETFVAVTLAAGVAILGFASPVYASTPDGETPANEGVCDVLKVDGITKGLYGLCVAYCEAQDLDTFDKEPPNSKILANYDKKKQSSDPDMPCVQNPCPCWSTEELAAFSSDGVVQSCTRIGNKIEIRDNDPALNLADADTTGGGERCRYVDLNADPRQIRSQPITQEEAQACFTAISTVCDSLGL